MKRTFSVSIVMNAIIFVLTVFATISIVIGFQFMSNINVLSSKNLAAFRYFTVDSNIFAGIISLIYVLYVNSRKKKYPSEKIITPRWLAMLKLAATTGVTLTMMVTVFFLAPSSNRGFFALFMNSNFFFHFFTPVLCILSFVFLEPVENLRPIQTITGIIPMLLYSIYYITNIFLNMNDGKIDRNYDFYNFLNGNIYNAWFVVPAIILITWLFSFLLWLGNKKIASKKVSARSD